MIELDSDETNIGVGMGGSCPSCRAPIDLGQEFCLECGAAIRFSNRPKSGGKRAGAGGAGGARAAAADANKGFPWVPFGIVLGLIVAVLVLLVLDPGGDSEKTTSPKAKTEPALPSITNSTPEDEGGETTTVDDCSSVNSGLGSPTPGVDPAADPNALGATGTPGGETIPELDPAALGMLDPKDLGITPPDSSTSAIPGDTGTGSDLGDGSSTPDGASAATIVDRNGTPCSPSSDLGTPITTPTTTPTASTTPTGSSPLGSPSVPNSIPSTPTTTPSTSTSGATGVTTWPADKVGWTVIVYGYPEEDRANERAADVQADGFDAGVLDTDDFGSLCPGIFVVFSGVFETQTQATNQKRRLQGKYQGMYVRKVDKNGTNSGCRN